MSAPVDKSVHLAPTAEKDRLLAEVYDLTGESVGNLTRAIWDAAEPHDFVQLAVGTIHPLHHATSRAKAIAALVGCSPKTGDRINKSETQHAETWPLQLASVLPFMSVRGAVAYISAATGMDEDDAEHLMRRHLGKERGQE